MKVLNHQLDKNQMVGISCVKGAGKKSPKYYPVFIYINGAQCPSKGSTVPLCLTNTEGMLPGQGPHTDRTLMKGLITQLAPYKCSTDVY